MKNNPFVRLLLLSLLVVSFCSCEKEYYDTKDAGESYLENNAKKDSVDLTYDSTYTVISGTDTTTESITITKRAALHVLSDGVQYAVYYNNPYGVPSRTDVVNYVKLNYTGYFINNESFESGTGSIKTYSSLITGLQEAISKMKTGEKWRVWIPYSLAYGSSGTTNTDGSYKVDPYSALIYDIELLASTY